MIDSPWINDSRVMWPWRSRWLLRCSSRSLHHLVGVLKPPLFPIFGMVNHGEPLVNPAWWRWTPKHLIVIPKVGLAHGLTLLKWWANDGLFPMICPRWFVGKFFPRVGWWSNTFFWDAKTNHQQQLTWWDDPLAVAGRPGQLLGQLLPTTSAEDWSWVNYTMTSFIP